MPAHRPEEVDLLVAEAFNGGQWDAVEALYEREAVLIYSGQVATGPRAIRELLRSGHSPKVKVRVKVKTIAQTSDIAMTAVKWDLVDLQATVLRSGHSVEVCRRQADGTWRFVIDVANLEWLQRTDS
jgi:ketosteroid isomerase-like protein